ncbi:type II toxin-antitoxin system PemK/MazF family toxin [Myxosarcina sp. GI1]|uniref:type II toxin-antitoxin system PemK/MazF family toxin n=1 Tax=Myxosarcina sp. GI1 TaxID=1541065 RepID=UPI00055EBB39|nr:type II toxin-antitoxin system PemK/MazF family toxin [Myxosarcina sp. GI1]
MRDYRSESIWLVNFEPQIGTEIKKTRPALIISASEFNRVRKKVTLLPITSKAIANPTLEPVVVTVKASITNGLDKDSIIIAIEPNTFDKKRCIKYLGQIDLEILSEVKQKLNIYLDLLNS